MVNARDGGESKPVVSTKTKTEGCISSATPSHKLCAQNTQDLFCSAASACGSTAMGLGLTETLQSKPKGRDQRSAQAVRATIMYQSALSRSRGALEVMGGYMALGPQMTLRILKHQKHASM